MAKSKDQFSKKEAASRFEAALRGARLAEPQPMKNMMSKRTKKQRKPRKRA